MSFDIYINICSLIYTAFVCSNDIGFLNIRTTTPNLIFVQKVMSRRVALVAECFGYLL